MPSELEELRARFLRERETKARIQKKYLAARNKALQELSHRHADEYRALLKKYKAEGG